MNDSQAERALLGALMLMDADSVRDVVAGLGPDALRAPGAADLLELIGSRAARQLASPGAALADIVTKSSSVPPSLTAPFVLECQAAAASPLELSALVQHLQDRAQRRAVCGTLNKAGELVRDGALSPADALAQLDHDRGVLELRGAGVRWARAGDAAQDYLEELAQADGNPLPAVATGYGRLDALVKLRPGMLALLAARPGLGKTALALNIGAHVARSATVGFVSLEMSKRELTARLLADLSGVPATRAQDGRATRADRGAMDAAAADLWARGLEIDDSPQHTLSSLRASARALVARYPATALIVVDYLQLLSAEPKDRAPREQVVAGLSRGLKALARELGVVILALSQLNRDGDGREPRLADLRESGALEQDADVVLLLHRPDLDTGPRGGGRPSPERQPARPEPKTGAGVPTELIVAKHRAGPTGRIGLTFDTELTRFSLA